MSAKTFVSFALARSPWLTPLRPCQRSLYVPHEAYIVCTRRSGCGGLEALDASYTMCAKKWFSVVLCDSKSKTWQSIVCCSKDKQLLYFILNHLVKSVQTRTHNTAAEPCIPTEQGVLRGRINDQSQPRRRRYDDGSRLHIALHSLFVITWNNKNKIVETPTYMHTFIHTYPSLYLEQPIVMITASHGCCLLCLLQRASLLPRSQRASSTTNTRQSQVWCGTVQSLM